MKFFFQKISQFQAKVTSHFKKIEGMGTSEIKQLRGHFWNCMKRRQGLTIE
jgi:hypothetical protein